MGKNNRVKGLILAAGEDTVFSQNGRRPFWFLFAGQMKMKPFEVFATSPEPGAVTAPRGQRRELAPNGFRKPVHRLTDIHSGILICQPPFVY